jgi:hypothetical protein
MFFMLFMQLYANSKLTSVFFFSRPIPVVPPKAAPMAAPTAAVEETPNVDEQKQKDRQFARESEKRFIRIQSVCRYIFGAFIGIMIAHILAVFIDVGLKIASGFSSIVQRAHTGVGNASGYGFGSIVSVVCFIYDTVKNNMVAAWRLFQNLCTLIVVGFVVYTYYKKSMHGHGHFVMPY